MKLDKELVSIGVGWLVLIVVVFVMFTSGCEVTREVVLDPTGVPTGIERVVVEGPGGDMVSVGHEVVERLAPLLPEPWNTILVALSAGFSAVFGSWVFRSKKEKKDRLFKIKEGE
ncbi:MAG TPA: hypothetical protein EYQ05_02895 [Gammaproteobacteria bacterium]|nr:hypothetical protein [Gammaproteobacteria bacterium]